jgi:hypothetical protein
MHLIWVGPETKYFRKWGWTGQISLIRFNNFTRPRKALPDDRA